MTQAKEACRRWTFEVARIRARFAKMSRRASQQPDEAPEIVEQALAACDVLIRELAASVETCDLATAGVRTQMALTDHLFQHMPIACGAIDREGLIINANQAASSLLRGDLEDGLAAVLAHNIGLLSTFVGEDLVLPLVQEAWGTPNAGRGPARTHGDE